MLDSIRAQIIFLSLTQYDAGAWLQKRHRDAELEELKQQGLFCSKPETVPWEYSARVPCLDERTIS